MKKIIIVTLATSATLLAVSLTPTEISDMVAKIKEERVGISLLTLQGTSNPFIINVKKKKESKKEVKKKGKKRIIIPVVETVYHIDAILNSAVFINKKWYKSGDKLGKYTVGSVSKDSVTLKSSSGNKVLKLKKKKSNFIKLNQGYE